MITPHKIRTNKWWYQKLEFVYVFLNVIKITQFNFPAKRSSSHNKTSIHPEIPTSNHNELKDSQFFNSQTTGNHSATSPSNTAKQAIIRQLLRSPGNNKYRAPPPSTWRLYPALHRTKGDAVFGDDSPEKKATAACKLNHHRAPPNP